MFDLVSNCCDIRKNWIEAAGFGSVLDLKITKVDRYFMTWLESKWDWKAQTLHIRDDYHIVIDEEMIGWITGLPMGHLEFDKMRFDDPELIQLEDMYDQNFGIDYTELFNRAVLEVDNQHVFLRHFILLTFGSLFCMNRYNFVTPKLLHILKDECIKNPHDWNWCGFVYDWMVGRGKETGRASPFVLLVRVLLLVRFEC